MIENQIIKRHYSKKGGHKARHEFWEIMKKLNPNCPIRISLMPQEQPWTIGTKTRTRGNANKRDFK